MIIYLVGMACVGKTTIGRMLAEKLGFTFFDINEMVEEYYEMPIERLQDECVFMNEFRNRASVVLDLALSKNIDSVIAGTPAGLKFAYLSVYKRHKKNKDLYSIHVLDTYENVLNRLTFFDKDSKQIFGVLNDSNRDWYRKDIRLDYKYFESSYKRADIEINIDGVKLEDTPDLFIRELKANGVELQVP